MRLVSMCARTLSQETGQCTGSRLVTAAIESGDFQHGPLRPGIGGDLALFLYGMRGKIEVFKVVPVARKKTFLGRITPNRFTSVSPLRLYEPAMGLLVPLEAGIA